MPSPSEQGSEEVRNWLMSMIQSAQARSFFGTLTIKMEGGEIKRVEKTESLLPPHSRRPS